MLSEFESMAFLILNRFAVVFDGTLQVHRDDVMEDELMLVVIPSVCAETFVLQADRALGEAVTWQREPRSASVRVLSVEAELWCLEKAAFVEVLTDHLREEIMRRIEIQEPEGDAEMLQWELVEDRHTRLRYALKQVKKASRSMDGLPMVFQNRCAAPGEWNCGECELLAEMDHPLILDIMNT
eukprot:Skav235848  [mRNA]  locus=scaffold1931:408523:413512:- [translate_table: standard]